jgi:chromate transporter
LSSGELSLAQRDAGRAAGAPPPLAEATRVWWRIGWLSFGGPTAQIALLHRMVVDERRWLAEREFLDALGFCMLLPGPEAMQLATYAGWRLHGVRGGLIAGGLFVLPGALVVLALSIAYATLGHVPPVLAAFHGIRAATLAIVVEAMVRLARRAIRGRRSWWVAALSFVALFVYAVPFPAVVLAALALGWLWPGSPAADAGPKPAPVPWRATVRTALVWLAIWILPLAAVAVILGPRHLLSQLAWYFSKLAVVTFGGAYAVLTWMSQEVVAHQGWLSARQMLDGLGLAETTPGPLILVTEYVGFLSAYLEPLGAPLGPALLAGLAGAGIALWATFAPCFLWIFTGAPYVVALAHMPRLKSGLTVLTAAVLGVIANLAVWFAMHVLFGHVATWSAGSVRVDYPVPGSLDALSLALTALTWLLLRRGWGVHKVLALCAVVAWGVHALRG